MKLRGRVLSRWAWHTPIAGVLMLVCVIPGPAVALEPALGDDAQQPITIRGVPHDGTYQSIASTLAEGERQPSCAKDVGSLWFRLDADVTRQITVDTVGSDFDTTLAVYKGAPGGDEIACHDDEPLSSSSRVAIPLAPETPYFVRVGRVDSGGQVSLHVRPTELIDVTTQYVVDDVGFGLRDGHALVRGVTTCSAPVNFAVSANLVQATPGATGAGDNVFSCLSRREWSVVIPAREGRFFLGEARLRASDEVCLAEPPCVSFAIDSTAFIKTPAL